MEPAIKLLKPVIHVKDDKELVKVVLFSFFLFLNPPFWFPDPFFKIICVQTRWRMLWGKPGAGWHFLFVPMWSNTSDMVSWCELVGHMLLNQSCDEEPRWNGERAPDSGLTAAKNSSTSAPVYTSGTREFFELTWSFHWSWNTKTTLKRLSSSLVVHVFVMSVWAGLASSREKWHIFLWMCMLIICKITAQYFFDDLR